MQRRGLIQGTLAAATYGAFGCAAGSRGRPGGAPPTTPDPLDAALERMHGRDPEFGGALSNHGPMACEALEALGAPEQIESFEAAYSRRLEPMRPSTAIAPEAWTTFVGKPEAAAGLIEYFNARLERETVDEVLAEVVPVLGPGLIGAAFHGLLRTAHAYRGWLRQPSDARRTELAHGLGYWTARHQPLPGRAGSDPRRGVGVLGALASVPIVPKQGRVEGLILERFSVLYGDKRFAEVVASYDPMAASPDEVIDALVGVSAQLYLTTPDPRSRFVYLHGVTGSSAARLLLPAVAPEDRRALATALFHAVAAVHATHGEPGGVADASKHSIPGSPDEFSRRASRSKDDHTIKFVEAALREFRRSGRPELLAAAAHRLEGKSA